MTNQEAFTLVVQHLRTQGAPSQVLIPYRACLYRHPDGIKRYAVGVLIPDSEYDTHMERQLLVDVARIPSLCHLDFGLLNELQIAHDRPSMPDTTWLNCVEQRFVEIASKFNLQVPPHPCLERPTDEATTLLVVSQDIALHT